MLNFIAELSAYIKQFLNCRLSKLMKEKNISENALNDFSIEYTPDKPFGDFSSNVAMVNAKKFNMSPQDIAKLILENIELENKNLCSANFKNGFISFNLSKSFYKNAFESILKADTDYGSVDLGKGKKVVIEYVSANPTGPMHLGNARGGAVGDILSEIMKKAGFDIKKEFFINDAGNQIMLFKKSLDARFVQEIKGQDAVQFPEDGYYGRDIIEIVQEYIKKYGTNLINENQLTREQELLNYALPKNIETMKETLERYKIEYDVWFSESSLNKSGAIKEVIDKLVKKGLTYKKDGALWYKFSASNNQMKDEVLVRENGNYTYFAADIAYGYNKFVTRGFEQCINVWGADHHGHVQRLKHALFDLGINSDNLNIVLVQVVRLTKNGKIIKMSKRTGKAIMLNDLLDKLPVDVVRFFFGMREANSHLDFNLDLAIEKSAKNPIYYIQYAHARICSIIKNAVGPLNEELNLEETTEMDLVKCLLLFPSVIEEAASYLEPSILSKYLLKLATKFHKFYSECRVVATDGMVYKQRLDLCKATKLIISNGLKLLKISAVEIM